MKKNKNLWSITAIAAVVVLTALSLTGCDDGSGGGGGGGGNSGGKIDYTADSIEALATWLDKQPYNAASAPYTIQLSVNDSTDFANLRRKLNAADKYVNLILSGPITTIPEFAFNTGNPDFTGCATLTGITIPNSVTSIGDGAFAYCSSLTSVTIGNGVTSIGGEAFSYCSGLASITVASGNTVYRSEGNCIITKVDTYYEWDGSQYLVAEANTLILVLGCKTSIIPDSVTSIRYYAFCGSGLTSITIPDSVTSIGPHAFYDCTSLASVTIGSGVTSIDYAVFSGCSGLTSVTIPDSVTSIGNSAFYYCSGMTSVTIGNGVTSIDFQAFFGCSGLTSVTFQGTITSANFSSSSPFPGDLRDKYLAANGGRGTYTRESKWSNEWTKQ